MSELHGMHIQSFKELRLADPSRPEEYAEASAGSAGRGLHGRFAWSSCAASVPSQLGSRWMFVSFYEILQVAKLSTKVTGSIREHSLVYQRETSLGDDFRLKGAISLVGSGNDRVSLLQRGPCRSSSNQANCFVTVLRFRNLGHGFQKAVGGSNSQTPNAKPRGPVTLSAPAEVILQIRQRHKRLPRLFAEAGRGEDWKGQAPAPANDTVQLSLLDLFRR